MTAIDEDYQEAYFYEYCKTCKYYDKPMEADPCNECLDNPVNLYSHKPVNWKEK